MTERREEAMKKHRWGRRVALVLCAVMLLQAIPSGAALGPRTLQVEQARMMALNVSSDLTAQKNEITLKQMKYVEAVKGIKAKIKNLRSFRWTPLLSFKFPEQLDLTNEYDLNIKPLTLQAEIDTMEHKLNDLRYEITDSVNQAYIDAYLGQESSNFTQERLTDAQEQLERNRAKLATGDATDTDVERAQSSVDTLTTQLSNQLREFEQAKDKLSELIGMDVSVGYRFVSPFKSAAIPREQLESITEYTLEHDQTYYEAKMATSTALLNLDSYESLMRSQYGSKMDYIQTYINMARQGMEIDYAAFQMKYNEMLTALDQPWAGKIRILFFSFTKEWFKGEISGTRYIEDEMYAVYTACMEYSNALKAQQSAEDDLRSQVRDNFEALVTAWNTYESLQNLASQSKETLERVQALNKLGKATYTEVADEQSAYQQAQQDALDALGEYNKMLSEYDRLTCGAITKYLTNAGMGLDTGEGGDAFAVLDPISDPYYYIYTSVADLTFYIGVSIPDGYEPAVDSFEVWYEGTQIGSRTPVGEELRHLTIDYGGSSMLTIRLYNGEEYVTECEVDASVPRDVLDLNTQPVEEATERVIGTYQVKTAVQQNVSLSTLTLSVDAAEGASTYTLTYGEQGIYTTDPISIDEPFTYLTLLISSLEDVTVQLYDSGGNPLTQARFDVELQQIVAPIETEG